MFKFFALLILIWIFFKAIGQVFKIFIAGSDTNRKTRYTNTKRTRHEGGVQVDNNPAKAKKDYKGGEYIDFEEVD